MRRRAGFACGMSADCQDILGAVDETETTMAKARTVARKKARKSAKRTAKKRKAVAKLKARSKARSKARRPARTRTKARKQSLLESVTGGVREAGALRSRLAGHNTFED